MMQCCCCPAGPKGASSVVLLAAAFLTFGAALAAAQTATITCFYTVPIAPGQRPAATPLVFKRTDGYEVCMRYQYKCSLNNPACLAQEAQSGTYKWHYMAADRAGCLSVAAASRTNGVRSVLCCSTNRCNRPDKNRDPATQIVLDSWLSRGTAKPARAAAVAQVPQAMAIPAAATSIPSSSSSAAAAPAPASARTSTPLVAALPDSIASNNKVAQPTLTSCLYGPTPGSHTVITMMAQPGMDVCARYEFKCTLKDTSCTATEVKNGTWKWSYMPTSKGNCDYIKSLPTVRHALCCSTNSCNTVDTNLDTKSIVQVPGVLNSYDDSNSDSNRLPQPTSHFANWNDSRPSNSSGKNSSRLDISVGVKGNNTLSSSSSNSSSSNSSSSKSDGSSSSSSLTCYVTYPWAPGRDMPQHPAVYSAQFNRSNGYETCVEYSYKCTTADATCTPAEARLGVWKTSYSALSKGTCTSLKTGVEVYKDVTCCESTNCNKPDASTPVTEAPVFTVA